MLKLLLYSREAGRHAWSRSATIGPMDRFSASDDSITGSPWLRRDVQRWPSSRLLSLSPHRGMIIGKIGVETPKYRLLKKTSFYEIREYPAQVAAVAYSNESEGGKRGDEFMGEAFMLLANYIGVWKKGYNVKRVCQCAGWDRVKRVCSGWLVALHSIRLRGLASLPLRALGRYVRLAHLLGGRIGPSSSSQ